MEIYEVQVQSPPGGWQGHEFDYDRSSDLFQCVNCGRYEVTVTNDDKTLQPCAPSAEWIEQQREAAARAAARKPRCPYSESIDDGWGEPGDYLVCTGNAGHDGRHQLAVRNEDDF